MTTFSPSNTSPTSPTFHVGQIVRTLGPQQYIIGRVTQIYTMPTYNGLPGQLNTYVAILHLGVRTYEGDNVYQNNEEPYSYSYSPDSLTPFKPDDWPEYFGPRKIRPMHFYYQKPPRKYENPKMVEAELKRFGASIIL